MYYTREGKLILAAKDLSTLQENEIFIHWELKALKGEVARPRESTGDLAYCLKKRGVEHERRVLLDLVAEGKRVIQIPTKDPTDEVAMLEAQTATIQAMEEGVEIIYQGTVYDGEFIGRPDLLIKVDGKSKFGDWSYRVVDVKLASNITVGMLLQVAEYNRQLGAILGEEPDQVGIVLKSKEIEWVDTVSIKTTLDGFRKLLEEIVTGKKAEGYPEPSQKFKDSIWYDTIIKRWEKDGYLALIPNIRIDQRVKFSALEVETVYQLEKLDKKYCPEGISLETFLHLKAQAKLQAKRLRDNEVTYEVIKNEGPVTRGLDKIPEPSKGDLFFDMEGDPLIENGGLEYLFGVTAEGKRPRFRAFWGNSRDEEGAAFAGFMEYLLGRLKRDKNMHVYHYANYEQAALKRLSERHKMYQKEVADLIERGIFVDLYLIIKQGLRTGFPSLGLKSIEKLYLPKKRGGNISSAKSSVVAFEEWLETHEEKILRDIQRYNKVDCDSTRACRNWLLAVREAELAKANGINLI